MGTVLFFSLLMRKGEKITGEKTGPSPFFKGALKPEWMEKGVPYLERGKCDIDPLFKRGEN